MGEPLAKSRLAPSLSWAEYLRELGAESTP